MWSKVLIFQGAYPIFDVGSLSYEEYLRLAKLADEWKKELPGKRYSLVLAGIFIIFCSENRRKIKISIVIILKLMYNKVPENNSFFGIRNAVGNSQYLGSAFMYCRK